MTAASRPFTGLLLLALVAALAASLPASAFQRPQEASRYEERTVPDPSPSIGVRTLGIAELDENDPLRQAWEQFRRDQGGGWRIRIDDRSGLPALAYGKGIAWIPGGGNDLPLESPATLEDLEGLARDFLEDHAFLLGDWDGQLVLDREASGLMHGGYWQVVFRQSLDGVPVEEARFDFQVGQGNLIAFGATRWAPVELSAVPKLDREAALAALLSYLEIPSLEGMEVRDAGTLRIMPLDPAGGAGMSWAGPLGSGYAHALFWRFEFLVPGEMPTWVAKVDAHTGEILAFFDDTKYERIKGGVFPLTDDGDGYEGNDQTGFPMPFADFSEDGGADVITGDHGLYQCSTLGAPIETNLVGPYVKIEDQCGSLFQSTICDEELDLGMDTGINCAVAPGDSPGNTGASRNSFYHVNKIKKLARAWLPNNSWLQAQLRVRTNVSSTCNATYSGTLNMYRDGNGCRNTGENSAVLVHEWGHGMDSNDGGGTDNPGEAYADVVAVLDNRRSCVGRGFFYSDVCSGYGDTCLSCTGIRDLDWDQRQDHTPATPAGFEASYCPGGGGPCGSEVHCAAYVPGEAVYDLAFRDLPASGLDADTAWQLTEQLFYLSREGSGGAAFNCSLPDSDGCGTNSWFHKLRVADDDDGDLSNGTPHAEAIFAAFDRHAIACGNANDTDNQNSSSCPSLPAPNLSLTARSNAVELGWDEIGDAAAYRVLRSEIGCDWSQGIVEDVAAPATGYLDDELANDFSVYYRVQAVGSNPACTGPVSACLDAAPQPFAGSVKFDQQTYGCSNRIGLQVRDANVGASTVSVTIWSDTEAAPETVILTETEPGSSKFLGEIYSTGGAPAADGLLSTTDGDTITVEYIDADDGAGGTNIVVQRTALSDCVFPLISGVTTTGVSDVQATISWLTDEGSDSAVLWGEGTPPTIPTSKDETVTSHQILLTGLQSCTVYYYQVESTDPAGNTAVSDNAGLWFRFETLGDFGQGLQPCHAGQLSLDRGIYSCSDTLGVEVVDIDLNTDPGSPDTVTVDLTSTTEIEPETIVLTETGPNTSVFRGSIATAGGSPTPDGVLQTADGDVATATYRDADDGAGYPAVSYSSGDLDCAGPAVSDLRVDTLTDARGTVRFLTSEPATVTVEWGMTPGLGESEVVSSLATAFNVLLNQFETCDTAYLRVLATDQHGNTAIVEDHGQPFHFDTWEIPGLYWKESFEGDTSGWTLGGEFEVGEPQGLGGSSGQPDPTSAYNNRKVLGLDLSGQGSYQGDYEPSSTQTALMPAQDASAWLNTKLIMYRRLNSGSGDDANIWLNTGSAVPIFRTDGALWQETSYEYYEADVRGKVDGSPIVQLQFEQTSNASGQYSSWNVDEIIFKDGDLPDWGVCGGCGSPPSFAGAVQAVDNDYCGNTGVTVSWERAVAWGTGEAGTYNVYRGFTPDFTPSAGTLIASGVTGLTYVDDTAPVDSPLYYIVQAENGETCSTGPANGGLVDGNELALASSDATAQPIPGSLGDSLRLGKINQAHVRLDWQAASDAADYHVYRSLGPEPGGFGQIADAVETFHDELNQLSEPTTFYYLVRAANACGQEGP